MESLQAFKSVNQSYVFISNSAQVLTYTIIIENISDSVVSNVKVTDIAPYGSCFQTNTFALNGCTVENADPNLGVNIGSIPPHGTAVITFNTIIDAENPPAELQNYATINYIDCANSSQHVSMNTNIVKTPIISVCVEILKNVNKCSVQLNDILDYRLVIKNNSTVSLENVMLYDSIPNELSVIPDSLFINGYRSTYSNLSQGINLGTMAPDKIILVLFQAIVDCLPCSTELENQAYLEFDYLFVLDESIYSSSGKAYSNTVSTKAGPESFKQIILDSTLNIPCKNQGKMEIIDKYIEVEITRQEIIETMKGASCEGQRLTGRKLLIDGTLKERIEYIELCSDQCINVAEYSIPFNTFIVLPQNCNVYKNAIVESTVENFDVKVISDGYIYQNVSLLLKVIY